MALFQPRFGYQPTEGAGGLSRRPWVTGFWRRAPVSGVLALVTAILCGIATIAVLRASDGLPINHWRVAGYSVQPTVLLSIFATLANALFRYAFTEGARISWWVQAQQGTSIGALHRSWDHSQSALPLATAGRDVTFNAVASFFVVMLLIDGPLFQRASSVGVVTRHNSTELVVPLSTSPFLMGATGIYADHDYSYHPTLLNPVFSKVLQQYNNRDPISLPEFGCKGKCELEVLAPGWDIECDNWTSPYRLMGTRDWMQWSDASSNNETYDGPSYLQTMFWNNITFDTAANGMWWDLYRYRTGSLPQGVSEDDEYYTEVWPYNTILLSSMRKSTNGGNGTLTWRYCALHEAVQRYPVMVTNTTVSIPRRNLQDNLTIFKVIRQPESSGQGSWPSTLGGFWLSLSQAFYGTAEIEHIGGWDAVKTNNSASLVYIDVANATMLNTLDVIWSDPMDDMIAMIQELSLRTAIATTSVVPQNPAFNPDGDYPSKAQQKAYNQEELTGTQSYIYSPNLTLVNRTLQQTVNASMHYEETVYQSNYDWMFGALAVILVAFCSILPTYGSWWHLGRTVSMSPIETAKAFDAPLLQQADPNGTGHDIAAQYRSTYVQYGTSLLHGDDRRNSVERAKASSTASVLGYGFPPNYLHFGREGTVAQPLEGQTFGSVQHETFEDHTRSSYSNSTYGISI